MAILAFKEKDNTINMMVAGSVSRDPEIKQTKFGEKVRFSIAYGKKKFQSVEAFADSPQGRLAGCLEKGDRVMAFGTWETWNNDGRDFDTLRADFIQVQSDAPVAYENGAGEATQPQGVENDPYSDLQDADDELPF